MDLSGVIFSPQKKLSPLQPVIETVNFSKSTVGVNCMFWTSETILEQSEVTRNDKSLSLVIYSIFFNLKERAFTTRGFTLFFQF